MYKNDSSKQIILNVSVKESPWRTDGLNLYSVANKRWIQVILLMFSSLLFSGFAHASEEHGSQLRYLHSTYQYEQSNNAMLLVAENMATEEVPSPILLSMADKIDQSQSEKTTAASRLQVKADGVDKAETTQHGSGLNNAVALPENIEASSVIMVVLGLLSLVWAARRT